VIACFLDPNAEGLRIREKDAGSGGQDDPVRLGALDQADEAREAVFQDVDSGNRFFPS
jgi:hypothetical protein